MSQEMYFSRMQKLLKDEYNAYIESLSKPLYRGMRMNLKKAELDEFDHLDRITFIRILIDCQLKICKWNNMN